MKSMGQHAPPTTDCPKCGRECKRHSVKPRTVVDIHRVVDIDLGVYWCPTCEKFFRYDLRPFVDPGKRYSNRLMSWALHLLEKGLTLKEVSIETGVPETTLHDWRTDEYADANVC